MYPFQGHLMAGVGRVKTGKSGGGGVVGPPVPSFFSRYNEDLEIAIRRSIAPVNDSGDGISDLYTMMLYHLGWANEGGELLEERVSAGKALRPTLCLFSCEAYSGAWEQAMPAAVALELVHNFSLIHDDIQDGDTERRHRSTLWVLWGQPQAITAGNAMRSLADMSTLRGAGLPEQKVLRASSLLTQAYLDMIRGQCMDLSFEGRLDIRLEDYLVMIACKTGALIRCGMEMGALIGTDDEDSVHHFAQMGAYLGRAFQIRDDHLGIWGDEVNTGKSVGNDIRRKKKSFPIVFALEAAEGPALKRLMEVYSSDEVDERDVDDVLDVLAELNAEEYSMSDTQRAAGLALGHAREAGLSPWAMQELEQMAEFLVERQS